MYVEVERFWTRIGGRLWWRHWSASREVVHGYMEFNDGRFDDWLMDPSEWMPELETWGRGRMPYRGDELEVTWLDDSVSARLRSEFWGMPVDGVGPGGG